MHFLSFVCSGAFFLGVGLLNSTKHCNVCAGGVCNYPTRPCVAKTAEEWASLGCNYPTATTVYDLGPHSRVTPTSSCEVTCLTDGGDFAVA